MQDTRREMPCLLKQRERVSARVDIEVVLAYNHCHFVHGTKEKGWMEASIAAMEMMEWLFYNETVPELTFC